jgi:hypothetical protein
LLELPLKDRRRGDEVVLEKEQKRDGKGNVQTILEEIVM